MNDYANNAVLLQEMIDKLGADLVLKWATFANSIEHPNIFHFFRLVISNLQKPLAKSRILLF